MTLKLCLLLSIFLKCCFCDESEFIKYERECTGTELKNGSKTEVDGIHTIFLQCWSFTRDAEAGLPYPKICNDDEVCRDLVCCPKHSVKYTTQSTGNIIEYDPIERYIYPRLLSSDPCRVPGTNISGIYKRRSECTEKFVEHKVCRFSFCKDFVCCPVKKTIPVYEPVEGKCLFETEEERLTETVGNPCKYGYKSTGTCRPYFQCVSTQRLDSCNVSKSQDVSVCGYDDCGTPFVCCADVDETIHMNTKSFFACKFGSYSNYPKLKISKLHENRTGECKSSKVEVTQNYKKIKYPYIADLGYIKEGGVDLQFECQGVLISSRFILTAAQCLELKGL